MSDLINRLLNAAELLPPALGEMLQEAVNEICALKSRIEIRASLPEAPASEYNADFVAEVLAADAANPEAEIDNIDALIAPEAPAVPVGVTGVVLVPRDPTPDMLMAAGTIEGWNEAASRYADECHIEWWQAMLDAAPPASSTDTIGDGLIARLEVYSKDWRERAKDVQPVHDAIEAIRSLRSSLVATPSAPTAAVDGAARDLLASLDPDALNPEQFNAWNALDAALSPDIPAGEPVRRCLLWAYDLLSVDGGMTEKEQEVAFEEIGKVLRGDPARSDAWTPNEWDDSFKFWRASPSPNDGGAKP
jgi:hypothetical protein